VSEENNKRSKLLREIPSTSKIVDDPRCESLIQNYGRSTVTAVVRESLDALREEVLNGQDKAEKLEDLIDSVEFKLRSQQTTLKSVVNATGVVLHTNLGRAPLSKETTQAMNDINEGYSNLEYDLTSGGRGSRFDHLGTLLRRLTGAEDALILNNNAGAVLTTLAAICAGGEVIISRGQLVEIGGGFRIPDVMSQSGCILREVGTTNRTRASDYLEAVGPDTKALMRVHPSNFSIEGFTEEASLPDIVKAAETNDLPVIDDIGSGSLIDSSQFGLTHEPLLSECIKDGADLVLASGDKLIGGPQSGIILGRKDLIARIKKHPLTRALRPDKGTIAGLIETLKHYEREEATTAIPIWQMISADTESLSARASEYVNAWKGNATVIPHKSTIGGGSLPGQTLPTICCGLQLPQNQLDETVRTLRNLDTPIISVINDGRLLLDPRTVLPSQDHVVISGLGQVSQLIHT
tara:strand:+ start:558 stop:1952 length:1395 start_codon:yes stop_codon:yes gene_type:complete